MDFKELVENNKLIAEFLYPNYVQNQLYDSNAVDCLHSWVCLENGTYEDLPYFKSYKHVDVIRLKILEYGKGYFASDRYEAWHYLKLLPDGFEKEPVYLACIAYIKAYNKDLKIVYSLHKSL